MTDAKKDEKKYYLKFIPKEELTGFMERLKTALANGQKSGEKKELEISKITYKFRCNKKANNEVGNKYFYI